jgi:hypothetical protein
MKAAAFRVCSMPFARYFVRSEFFGYAHSGKIVCAQRKNSVRIADVSFSIALSSNFAKRILRLRQT